MVMENASNKSKQNIHELGISFNNYTTDDSFHGKAKKFNSKLKIYREFVLATLSALAKERKQNPGKEGSSSQTFALDAYSCTGIAAIQWKKHLQEDVHITAADHDDVALLKQNAENNSITCQQWQLDPSRVPGDPIMQQSRNEVFVCQADARSLMTMEAFNFIYLNPYKNGCTCLEPAFHSLTCGGVLSLVVPDLSIFARAPHVVRRSFSAQVIKTEYLREMAARIVLAEAARSAAKYSKGISILYVVSQDDFLLITVRVHRGQKAVDSSLNNVSQLLHCRFCEERAFLATQLAPLDNPYSFLTCTCKSKNLGKTAVILGPMWKGCIFNTTFLDLLSEEGSRLGLSAKFADMLGLLLTESKCTSIPENSTSEQLLGSSKSPVRKNVNAHTDSESLPVVNKSRELSEQILSPSHIPAALTPVVTKQISSHCEDHKSHDTLSEKRKSDLTEEDSCIKRRKKDVEDTQPQGVPFYYSVSRSKKGVTLKLNKLVMLLQNNNHRASRTHFDSCAIRTSASVLQFEQLLD